MLYNRSKQWIFIRLHIKIIRQPTRRDIHYKLYFNQLLVSDLASNAHSIAYYIHQTLIKHSLLFSSLMTWFTNSFSVSMISSYDSYNICASYKEPHPVPGQWQSSAAQYWVEPATWQASASSTAVRIPGLYLASECRQLSQPTSLHMTPHPPPHSAHPYFPIFATQCSSSTHELWLLLATDNLQYSNLYYTSTLQQLLFIAATNRLGCVFPPCTAS